MNSRAGWYWEQAQAVVVGSCMPHCERASSKQPGSLAVHRRALSFSPHRSRLLVKGKH